MSVVAFRRKQTCGTWSEAELNTIVSALSAAFASGSGREWETGMTENGDAQFYLLGSPPEQACELCLSRIGMRYILEDGSGRLLFEHQNLALVALHAKTALRSGAWWLVAHVVLLSCAVRRIMRDKVDPWLAEGEELLVELAPHLATFA